MTAPRIHVLALVATLAAGCSSGSTAAFGGHPYGSGGTSAAGGMAAAGGAWSVADAGSAFDGGIPPKPDAGRGEKVLPTLVSDPPPFSWGTDAGSCPNCTGGSSGSGGRGGSSGTTGTGGSRASGGTAAAGSGGIIGRGGAFSTGGSASVGGFAGVGGAVGFGGVSYPGGGVPAMGGSTSTGGGGLLDAGVANDASKPVDARPDSSAREASTETGLSPDALAADVSPADSPKADTTTRCVAQIAAVIPVTDSFEDAKVHLTAGDNAQVVLRASVVSGGPPAGVSWLWQASQDGMPLSPIYGKQDPAAAAFPIATAGDYSFTAYDKATGACSATVNKRVFAYADSRKMIRLAPPPSSDVPVQSGANLLTGISPFSQSNIVVFSGVPVQISPFVGSDRVLSYIRINGAGGELTVDGLANPQTGGFAAGLIAVNEKPVPPSYDVLVVPLDGQSDTTVAATAPQLFQNLTPSDINRTSFKLAGGVTVTGTTQTSTGPVANVRVMLTNQDPAASQQSKLIFSSVGNSDDKGNYLLKAQPGSYWVSLSPTDGSGLPDAISTSSVTLNADTTIGFQWAPITTSTLVLNVLDAAGSPSALTRVRLTSAQANVVGSLTVGTGQPLAANGNVQVEGTTSATGTVTFANLPDGASYNALLVPAILGSSSATTAVSVALPQGGGTQTVSLLAQGRINGQLVVGSNSTIDWSTVSVYAYDRSTDTPEATLRAGVSTDGSYSLAVSPGRPYVVLVVPNASSSLARTFVAPGLIQATEFTFTQKVQSTMLWSAMVMDTAQSGLPGTAIQYFCTVDWPGCVDPTIPLAETTSGDGGAFQLWLPDPATR